MFSGQHKNMIISEADIDDMGGFYLVERKIGNGLLCGKYQAELHMFHHTFRCILTLYKWKGGLVLSVNELDDFLGMFFEALRTDDRLRHRYFFRLCSIMAIHLMQVYLLVATIIFSLKMWSFSGAIPKLLVLAIMCWLILEKLKRDITAIHR